MAAFSLAHDQHLYVQLWRHETGPFSNTNSTARVATLTVNDGTADIVYPSVTALPNLPGLDPVAGARVNATPMLKATYSDLADNGTVSIKLCSDSSCTSTLQGGPVTSGSLADGQSWSWQPSALADGSYWWSAMSTDSANDQSIWSTPSAFIVDTVPADVPSLGAPADKLRVNSSTLHATFTDSVSHGSGSVEFKLCSDSPCTIAVTPDDTSSPVVDGGAASWTPSIPDGTYYWQVRSIDNANNVSAWSAVRKFVLDTHPPDPPSLTGPDDGSHVNSDPALQATFSSSDALDSGTVSLQVCSDPACGVGTVQAGALVGSLANGQPASLTTSGLADGVHYWRARAQDAAGNLSGVATRSFTLDTTPPSGPSSGGPANALLVTGRPRSPRPIRTRRQAATPVASSSRSARRAPCPTALRGTTFGGLHQNDAASWTPSGLDDGTYYWRVRAEDSAGNFSDWSAARSFTIDSTPPPAPLLAVVSGLRVHAPPQLVATVVEPGHPGDSSRLLVELCSDPACTSIVTTGYSGVVSVDTMAGWQAPQLPDGAYYWRTLAEDAAGNQSPWSALGGFVLDTVAPAVPVLGGPADAAIVNPPHLIGVPDASASGVAFQVCADAECAHVLTGGYAFTPPTDAAPTWTPTGLADGTYFWRIAAHDAAGNVSAWSQTKSFVLDQTPPGTPLDLHAKVTGTTLTLSWLTPTLSYHLAGYTLLVNGKRTRKLTLKTHVVRIQLRKSEKRIFAVASVDAAGNVSRPTRQVAGNSLQLTNKVARGAAPPPPPPVAHRR